MQQQQKRIIKTYEAYPEYDASSSSVTAEKNLLKAMLRRAIDDLTDKDKSIRLDATRWFKAAPSDTWGSFYFICSYLDIDPIVFRKKIFNLS